MNKKAPHYVSKYRTNLILSPEVIRKASGIIVNGRRYKSFLFSSDVATIMYSDADAILAVYPYSPHPSIIKSLSTVAQVPLAAGVGGGVTQGRRSVDIAQFAESYGCFAVVLNSAVKVDTIKRLAETIDIPIIYTVISKYQDLKPYFEAGVAILNISGAQETSTIVHHYREIYPNAPIIATGGKKDEDILETIEAGANAITYTPPSTKEVFKERMNNYREDLKKEYIEEQHREEN
ncbi:MAG: hydrolase [Atopostipes sp.]|nr:hydrolase [Atopostipes sp.]